jgi:hypothetical protein
MIEHDAELLDAALEGSGPARHGDELRGLTDVATDVTNVLRSVRLTAAERDALYRRVLRLRARRRLLARGGWRLPAIVGGGLVTAGAVAAIVVAVSRGRRSARLPLPA